MKKILAIASAALLLLASCSKTELTPQTQANDELLSKNQLDDLIRKTLQATNKFEWIRQSPQVLWSAAQQSDLVMAVGYQPTGFKDIDTKIHQVDIRQPEWSAVKDNLLQAILASEKKLNKDVTMEQIIQWENDVLPVLNVNIRNIETVKMLTATNTVRYVEPMGYEPQSVIDMQQRSSSGCGSNNAEPGLVNDTDYTVISPNAKQSWNYGYHNIPQAWNTSTGRGVKIFIIDTGLEYDQENMGSAFNQGRSSGRTVERIVTLPRSTFLGIPTGPVETPDDGCGHGTSMAGAAAAPRGTDGNAVGIAYNSNLVVCRAAEDVLIDGSRENKGVADAFINAANRSDVRIISMSMGRITSNSQITDAINYANNKSKLIFCAAGTSFGWTAGWYGVIFPAWLGSVNAVTGVRDNNYNQNCTACHDGSETDFTVVMEKASNERHPLSLAMYGDAPSTVGGSSVSTASMAGMAALVWSRFPTYTKAQVLDKLVRSSANYPTRNGSYGWGNVNAALAVQ